VVVVAVVVVLLLPLPPPPHPRSLASYDVDANDDPRALVVVVVEDAVATRSRRYWEDDGIPIKKNRERGPRQQKKCRSIRYSHARFADEMPVSE